MKLVPHAARATLRALSFVVVVGCHRRPAAIADSPPVGSASDSGTLVPAATTTADAADAASEPPKLLANDPSANPVPWVEMNVDFPKKHVRLPGQKVRPVVEFPSRAFRDDLATAPMTLRDAVQGQAFPFVPIRTHGLPAMSADGTRVAHVYGPLGCCRGTGYSEFSLYVFDVKTGATRAQLALWSVKDEDRFPPPGDPSFEKAFAAYEALASARLAAIKAALDGEWVTLGALDVDDKEFQRELHGEGLDIRLAAKVPFPPLVVTQGGAKHEFPGTRWRVLNKACPADSLVLRLGDAWALKEKPFAIVETFQGVGMPDGCEGANMKFASWAK